MTSDSAPETARPPVAALMWLVSADRPGSALPCRVCGRTVGDDTPFVEIQLDWITVRACSDRCYDERADASENGSEKSLRELSDIARRLSELYREITAAQARNEITFRDALPMLLKLTAEQSALLRVTGPT